MAGSKKKKQKSATAQHCTHSVCNRLKCIYVSPKIKPFKKINWPFAFHSHSHLNAINFAYLRLRQNLIAHHLRELTRTPPSISKCAISKSVQFKFNFMQSSGASLELNWCWEKATTKITILSNIKISSVSHQHTHTPAHTATAMGRNPPFMCYTQLSSCIQSFKIIESE